MSGCVGIAFTSKGYLILGCYFIFIAAFFDLFDGLLARLLKVESKIGKDLDSLADVVSFGVLPALIVFKVLETVFALESTHPPVRSLTSFPLAYIAFIIPVFSALRLAKFNNDLTQKFHFKGLPTPANALFWGSLILSIKSCLPLMASGEFGGEDPTGSFWDCGEFIPSSYKPLPTTPDGGHLHFFTEYYFNKWFLISSVIITSLLLVSPLQLISLKIQKFSFKKYLIHFLLLGVSIFAAVLVGFASAPIILILYIILSQIHFATTHEIQS